MVANILGGHPLYMLYFRGAIDSEIPYVVPVILFLFLFICKNLVMILVGKSENLPLLSLNHTYYYII